MNITPVQQGSKPWLELRRTHDTASEAPAALGLSKYTSRTDLMKQKLTGAVEEVGLAKQRLFDRGHESEAMARPLAESIIGSELYPVTATLEIAGLKLLASLDGSTMDEEIIFEHKLWSESLAEDVRNGTLSANYTLQMDQQLLVSGADKCLFMTSDGTDKNMAWCWYETTPEKKATLIAGWHQFHADLAAYVPPVVTVAPVAKTVASLPVVFDMRVEGKLVSCNLEQYKPAALAYIADINTELLTDQNFADADADAKFCRDSADKLELAIEQALGQMGDINAALGTVRDIAAAFDAKGLALEKLVKAEKENRRNTIISEAAAEFVTHMRGLNERLGGQYMPVVQAEFQQVVKGLKSIDSTKAKVQHELARVKIESSGIADRIQTNLKLLDQHVDMAFLFNDKASIVLKQAEDFALLVKARIDSHKAAEAAKEEETRERIRAEEQAKAEQAAREKLAAEAAKVERIATAPDVAPVTPPGPAAAAVTHAQVVQQMPATVRRAMAPAETPPTLTLGEISTRLSFNVTSAFLATLGFEATTVKAAKLYHSDDFPAICEAIKTHISEVQDQFEPVAA